MREFLEVQGRSRGLEGFEGVPGGFRGLTQFQGFQGRFRGLREFQLAKGVFQVVPHRGDLAGTDSAPFRCFVSGWSLRPPLLS